jgi:hypothetical protein
MFARVTTTDGMPGRSDEGVRHFRDVMAPRTRTSPVPGEVTFNP